MNIYFHIDELNRDAIVASSLKKKFKKKGHKLIYGNRASSRLLNYFHGAFDIIIMPRPHFLNDIWGKRWMSWSTKVIILSSESLGIICKDHHVMARTLLEKDFFEGNKQIVNKIALFCYWGPKQLQAIKDYAPEITEKCHVVGHPRHDQHCINKPLRISKQDKKQKNNIGIITRAVALNDYYDRSPLDSFFTLFDPHFQYEYFNRETGSYLVSKRPQTKPGDTVAVQAIDVQTTLKIIERLKNDNFNISLRLHPKEKVDVWRTLLEKCNLDVQISESKLPITSWLQGQDYVIGPPSTSFYDAVMLNITPISICNLDKRRKGFIGELYEENNQLMEYVYKPESIESLVKYINDEVQNTKHPQILAILGEEADFPECSNSLEKVVSLCCKLEIYKKERKNWLLLFNVARFLLNNLLRIKMFKSGQKQSSAVFLVNNRISKFIDNQTTDL